MIDEHRRHRHIPRNDGQRRYFDHRWGQGLLFILAAASDQQHCRGDGNEWGQEGRAGSVAAFVKFMGKPW